MVAHTHPSTKEASLNYRACLKIKNPQYFQVSFILSLLVRPEVLPQSLLCGVQRLLCHWQNVGRTLLEIRILLSAVYDAVVCSLWVSIGIFSEFSTEYPCGERRWLHVSVSFWLFRESVRTVNSFSRGKIIPVCVHRIFYTHLPVLSDLYILSGWEIVLIIQF